VDSARKTLVAAFRPDFAVIHWRFAVRASFGVAIAIFSALHFGSTLDALAAGVGAVSSALPSLTGDYRTRLLGCLATALAMSSASYIAGMAGSWTWAIVTATAGSAYIYGILSRLPEPAGAVGLQALLATIILGNIGTQPAQMGGVALAVLGGGLVQTLIVALEWAILPHAGRAPVFRAFDVRTLFNRYAGRVALVVAVAMLIFRLGHIERGYWIALTAAIVLRPDYRSTFSIVIARVAGTIAGAVLAWGIAALIPTVPSAHAAAAIGFALFGFFVFRVGPAFYAIGITGFVIFLLSMVGGRIEAGAVEARIVATLIGGGLALIAFAFGGPKGAPDGSKGSLVAS